MPYESILPATYPTWDIDIGYPTRYYGNAAVGTPVSDKGQRFRRGFPGDGFNQQTYMTSVAGNHIDPDMWFHNGMYCLSPNPGAFTSVLFFCDAATIQGPLNSEGLVVTEAFNCQVSPVEYRRVYIDEAMVAFSTAGIGGLTPDTCVWKFTPDIGQNQTSLYGVLGTHYGLIANGTGGINFASVIANVVQESTPLTWPVADFRTWVRVRTEHMMARPAGPGQLRIWLNDTLVITRNWGPGTTLPDLTTGVPNARHVRRYFGQPPPEPAHSMFLTAFRSRIGRFTVEGTEVT